MRKYIYADESGNFDFTNNQKASRYFILTTVLIDDHSVERELLDLRRELAWNGITLPREFHATEDTQFVRDQVFGVLNKYEFRIDATILEKRKVAPHITSTEEVFYKYAWFYHMRYVAPRVTLPTDELLVIAASIGVKRKLRGFLHAIKDVVEQTSPARAIQIDMWPASVDPCLQVADYCSWAIQRKWESGDHRSYDLIESKIRSEFDLLKTGTTYHY